MDVGTSSLIVAAIGAGLAAARWGREDSKTAVDTMNVAMAAETKRADRATERADREARCRVRLEARVRQLEQLVVSLGGQVPPERRSTEGEVDDA